MNKDEREQITSALANTIVEERIGFQQLVIKNIVMYFQRKNLIEIDDKYQAFKWKFERVDTFK